ncbi:hypothetical protein LMG32289_05639 [Cupriavidus pampae]|uniref:Uncharacterized protein n=1 Tax=Cupriavidus pampae TaxID=659251 RepID=A0ABM8XVU3_9BURK|nr:hypothetical protein LMG32289_05639 [Cupriavidus pampae]
MNRCSSRRDRSALSTRRRIATPTPATCATCSRTRPACTCRNATVRSCDCRSAAPALRAASTRVAWTCCRMACRPTLPMAAATTTRSIRSAWPPRRSTRAATDSRTAAPRSAARSTSPRPPRSRPIRPTWCAWTAAASAPRAPAHRCHGRLARSTSSPISRSITRKAIATTSAASTSNSTQTSAIASARPWRRASTSAHISSISCCRVRSHSIRRCTTRAWPPPARWPAIRRATRAPNASPT